MFSVLIHVFTKIQWDETQHCYFSVKKSDKRYVLIPVYPLNITQRQRTIHFVVVGFEFPMRSQSFTFQCNHLMLYPNLNGVFNFKAAGKRRQKSISVILEMACFPPLIPISQGSPVSYFIYMFHSAMILVILRAFISLEQLLLIQNS